MTEAALDLKPQEGPQEEFLSTSADIAIYGGGAGGGKTFGILLEPLRHIHNPAFGCVVFRRNTTQIRNEGGLWDDSQQIYPHVGATGAESRLEWRFDAGAKLKFAHLEFEKTVFNYQGAQIPLIIFDELTHFTKKQFWYMFSRNRSTCGVRPYVRATCNPDPDSFVAELIAWWIDQETGLAIPERSGVIRYFIKLGDDIHWADTREELIERFPDETPKSLTFIASTVFDNKILLREDPGYLANLKALDKVERERLLGCNWKIRASAGLYFKKSYFEVVDQAPANARRVRGWDFAATDESEGGDPDWTVGTKMSKTPEGIYYVEDVERLQGSPLKVNNTVKNTASQDGKSVIIDMPQDPGAAGKADAQSKVAMLAGYTVKTSPETGDKITRASAFSAQAEAGNVKIVRGPWNEVYLNELEGFPGPSKDDQVDASSRAFHRLSDPEPPKPLFGTYG